MDMSISAAQADMREGYLGGGTGILASALAWSVAAVVAATGRADTAIWVLLVGGMFIYPVGLLICRLAGGRGRHRQGNPLGQLAGASTFWLIFCLPLAYGLGLREPTWFFAAMLLVIGGRYLVFASVYGMRLYWALGLALAAAGCVLAVAGAPAYLLATAGAALEAVFGVVCLVQHRRAAAPART